MGTFTQGRYALLIDKDNSKLIKTPSLSIDDVAENRTLSFLTNDGKSVNLKSHLNLKGDEYELFNDFNHTLSKTQKNKYIHEFISLNNYNLIKWDIKSNPNTASIIFNADLELKNYIKTYDNLKYVGLYPIKIPKFEKPKNRNQDVIINYPINIIDTLKYFKIEGYKFKALKDTSIASKFGTYKLKSNTTEKEIIVTKQFILNAGTYSLKEYKQFYNFLQTIKNIERKNPIIFETIKQ